MLDNVAGVFENFVGRMKRIRKSEYKKFMFEFQEKNGATISEMLEYIKASEDKNGAARECGDVFSEKAFDLFSKNGRMKGTMRADMSLYMIYYVFPAILLTEDENATVLCDNLKDAWNAKFKENIGYTDFDTICGGFKDKIFGLF